MLGEANRLIMLSLPFELETRYAITEQNSQLRVILVLK